VLATWFGCGRVPYVPGTAGSIGAIPLYLLVRPHGLLALAVTALGVAMVGVWAAGVVAEERRERDPQVVCIDEVAGMLATLVAAPLGWPGLVVSFAAFRLCDQLKPWPVNLAERLPLGWGIVSDDLVAAAWAATLVCTARSLGWI
jgi:phosphatidylglycerophosphatase A